MTSLLVPPTLSIIAKLITFCSFCASYQKNICNRVFFSPDSFDIFQQLSASVEVLFMYLLGAKSILGAVQCNLRNKMTTKNNQLVAQMAQLSIWQDLSAASVPEFSLRSYQNDAIEAVQRSIEQGFRRNAVVLATGGGKTVVFSHLIPQLSPLEPTQGHKTLVLAHRQELVLQASASIQRFNPNLNVQIDMHKHKPDENADVIVASVNTLARLTRLERYLPSEFKTIILDECHHATANLWTKILTHFDANHLQLKINVVGFTATLERADGEQLSKAFDNIAYERSLADMIRNGELSDIKYHTLDVKVDLLRANIAPNRDFTAPSLDKIMNQSEVCEQIAGAYMKLQKEFQFKLTIIFCCSVEHCMALCSVLQELGVNAQYVTGTTKLHNRMDILDDFRNGKIQVLCNVLVFTEGTDIPNIDSLLLARPTKSRSLLVQMVGRGLRLHEGKTVCHVVDIADTSHIGLVSVPTLLGLELDMGPKHKNGSDKGTKEEKEIVDIPLEELTLGEDGIVLQIGSQAQLIADTVNINTIEGFAALMLDNKESFGKSREVNNLIGQSPLNWLRLAFNTWSVPCPERDTFLTLTKIVEGNEEEPMYRLSLNSFVHMSQKLAAGHKLGKHRELETLMESTNLAQLLNKAKVYIDEQARMYQLFSKYQLYKQYDRKNAITESQRIVLEKKFDVKVTQHYHDPEIRRKLKERISQMSSWEASNLIFAHNYLVNSMWVHWELERMLGFNDKKKRQVERMVSAKKKAYKAQMKAERQPKSKKSYSLGERKSLE